VNIKSGDLIPQMQIVLRQAESGHFEKSGLTGQKMAKERLYLPDFQTNGNKTGS
jgi:hypothetical protein